MLDFPEFVKKTDFNASVFIVNSYEIVRIYLFSCVVALVEQFAGSPVLSEYEYFVNIKSAAGKNRW